LNKKFSIFILLIIAFIDYFGIGLVYPLFSSMLFNVELAFFSADTSNAIRGLFLGLLLGIQPLFSFFSAPILGTFSDQLGRKRILVFSLLIAILGYAIGWYAVSTYSIIGLLFFRLIVGISAGSVSVVQASIADISTKDNKSKNFGLYNMALGTGFTLGPFLGGKLSDPEFFSFSSYSLPFLFTVVVVIISLFLVFFFFRETIKEKTTEKISLLAGVKGFKKAFHMKGLRILFLLTFLFVFGWSLFFEFIPVYLIDQFAFKAKDIGNLYGLSGAMFAISSGILIRPLINRFSPYRLFLVNVFIVGAIILILLILFQTWQIYVMTILLNFFSACIFPSITTLVSNKVEDKIQGEILGLLSSTYGLALAISPLTSGAIAGLYPFLPILVGSICMFIVGILLMKRNIKIALSIAN
jgi:MFS transporter, DHA1 family, tetracycline resistance protein